MFSDPLIERMAAFVRDIGIDVRAADLPEKTFLPGLDIRHGAILLDPQRLSHPGDLLHEAGHVAVSEPSARDKAALEPTSAEEMAALAWSYAALRHLDLAPEIVFHRYGYKGGAQTLIDAFAARQDPIIGVPLLAYYGMTVEAKVAAERGVEPFPHMLRWLREAPRDGN